MPDVRFVILDPKAAAFVAAFSQGAGTFPSAKRG